VNTHNESQLSKPDESFHTVAVDGHLRVSAHAQSKPVRINRAFTLFPEAANQIHCKERGGY